MRRRTEWEIAGPPGTDGDGERARSLMSPDPDAVWQDDPPAKRVPYVFTPTELSPAEARHRRRVGLSVRFGADFDVAAEVATVCGDSDVLIAAVLQKPVLVVERVPRQVYDGAVPRTVYFEEVNGRTAPGWVLTRPQVDALAGAVQGLWESVVKLLVTRGALSQEARAAVHAVRDIPLAVSDEQIESGAWIELLVARVQPVSADLSTLLGVAKTSDRGPDELTDELRPLLRAVDQAAEALARRIPHVQGMYATSRRWFAEQAEKQQAAEHAQAERLGL